MVHQRSQFDTERILRSLAAVGATLVAASDAKALKFTVDQTVSITNGVTSAPFVLSLPGVNGLAVQAVYSGSNGATAGVVQIHSVKGGQLSSRSYAQVQSAVRTGFFDAASGAPGARWNSFAQNSLYLGTLGGVRRGFRTVRTVVSQHSFSTSNGGKTFTNIYSTKVLHYTSFAFATTYSNKYFPFRFKDSTQANRWTYGWIEASLIQQTSPENVAVQILRYAYEPNGQQIAMGDLPSDAIPEPASAGMMAIGAMILGAKGIRRWKSKPQSTDIVAA